MQGEEAFPLEADPVAIDLNVDAALVLKELVGIDSYPPVLALLPNIYRLEDRERVHAVVAQRLTEAGIIDGDRVHPVVEHWVRCLDRPDVELAARIMSTGSDGQPRAMLRFSLVRSDDTHVLALRCDDEVVIQTMFQDGQNLDNLTAALAAALGPAEALRFTPVTATVEQLGEVPSDPDERRQALLELGAQPHTAAVLSRALTEVVRRAEILVIEHRDGSQARPEVSVSVLDTTSGRLIVTPSRAMDGEIWSTFAPGDDAALRSGIGALIDLVPGRSWFDTSRTS
ncbi:ESX secretion-associated protein EspG [Nocardia implantans]|uniref:ESX secretion-associated protein EspG n=1 Tax=Nocardia implantans TaxID=3108168 RepID=A0ABU6APQ2_9NOCA|nr:MULTISPECIES: ESX secretion-associated protein EspG [unclassified Nocardia]MEA3526971.1 ESX secretion-associated protein EspG [Nocardia sp. CDC192]MEB3509451.1 ESX secretion-associated protein EspG [Nocardia sp. CDC186]